MALLTAKNRTKAQCACLFTGCWRQSPNSSKAASRNAARSAARWRIGKAEIGRMWRFSRSNGITEGFHRKMKLIQRRAFGFRNFENYRRRVRALCA